MAGKYQAFPPFPGCAVSVLWGHIWCHSGMLLRLRNTPLAEEVKGSQSLWIKCCFFSKKKKKGSQSQAFLEFQGNRGCLLLRFQIWEIVSTDLSLHGQGQPDLATSTEEGRAEKRSEDKRQRHQKTLGFFWLLLLFDCAVRLAGFQFPRQGLNLGYSCES